MALSQWRHVPALLLLIVLMAAGTRAQELIATLDYGTFKGAYSEKYNISHWRRVPFAAPPVGLNRFRAPQPPEPIPNGTIYDSNQPFDMCPQRSVGRPTLSPCLFCVN